MQKLFRRKKLLIISGPTACGKTTFCKSLQSDKQPELTHVILDKAFLRDSSCIKALRMRGLRRNFYKEKSLRNLTKNHSNFILEMDTTGQRMIQNLILLPALLKEFDRVLVVHNYVSIDVWIERIHERRLGGFKTSRYVNQIFAQYQSTAKKASQAHSHYCDYYSNFERFFIGLGVKEQMCINTIESLALARPFPFN